MKKTFLILAKMAVFIVLMMIMGAWLPYLYFIRVNMSHIMSLDTAIYITDIIGGYPEPYDLAALLIAFFLNILISIVCCKLIFMLARRLKKTISPLN